MTLSHSVCVFCGARPGIHPSYMAAARQLGQTIAARNWRLVYGAGDAGIMGQVSGSAQNAGADILGVIPTHLEQREMGKKNVTNYIVTDNMHTRKKIMFMNCDAIIVLPGGAGTMDEFFEVLTWAQLDLHKKPIILLNVNHYWDPLIALLNHLISQGFADRSLNDLFHLVENVDDIINLVEQAA